MRPATTAVLLALLHPACVDENQVPKVDSFEACLEQATVRGRKDAAQSAANNCRFLFPTEAYSLYLQPHYYIELREGSLSCREAKFSDPEGFRVSAVRWTNDPGGCSRESRVEDWGTEKATFLCDRDLPGDVLGSAVHSLQRRQHGDLIIYQATAPVRYLHSTQSRCMNNLEALRARSSAERIEESTEEATFDVFERTEDNNTKVTPDLAKRIYDELLQRRLTTMILDAQVRPDGP